MDIPAALAVCVAAAAAVAGAALLLSGGGVGGSGLGNGSTIAQLFFGAYVRCGRLRNTACSPCDRARSRYPVAATCQIPFFKSVGEIYSFVLGYKRDGVFVEVGAYDGESFSNTSGLADIGWSGHYLEPIPAYAAACAARHAGNAGVTVHTMCIGEKDGAPVELSTAGPFSSAVGDEIAAVSSSKMGAALKALGWSHEPHTESVKTTTTALNTFYEATPGLRVPGVVDVMVVDTEVGVVPHSLD